MTITAFFVAALLQTVPAARISNVTGEVDVIRSGGTVAAHTGDTVLVGDRVHTLTGSAVALSVESGVTLQLRPETTLEMKNIDGESRALLSEGGVNVRSMGKPARIETKYGRIVGTEDFQEFDISYSGDVVQVLLIVGSVRAEVSDSSKVVFKNAYDFGVRVYEAGSISPTAPRATSGTTVIVYPRIDGPTSKDATGRRTGPVNPPLPPK